jgi:hypothetical protein
LLALGRYDLGREELHMLTFLCVALGAIVAFLGPSLLPQQFRNAFVASALRIIGVLMILFAIAVNAAVAELQPRGTTADIPISLYSIASSARAAAQM